MAQWINALATKSDELSLIPSTYKIEKTSSFKLASDLAHTHCSTHMPTDTQINNYNF